MASPTPTIIWRQVEYTLPAGHHGIGEVIGAAMAGLPKLGFTNVRFPPNSYYLVAGKGQLTLEIRWLAIDLSTQSTFWQVVVGATMGPQADADGDVSAVVTMLSQIQLGPE